MTTGSVFVRKALGAQLKALRLAAGKTYADVKPVGSPAKMKRIEAGDPPIKMPDVNTLCFFYGADKTTTEQLIAMALNVEEDWWDDYTGVMPSWLGKYIALESISSRLTTFDAETVHGLLQTPNYHRAIFEADADVVSEDVERTVELRAERQRAAFERDPPLKMTAIVGEAALLRAVGGEAVMVEQRAHLLRMCVADHVDAWVLPLAAGAHAGMKGAFTILSVDRPGQPDVVYLESVGGARYMEKHDVAERYRRNVALLLAQSIPIEEYLS